MSDSTSPAPVSVPVASSSSPSPPQQPGAVNLRIVSAVLMTFICYLSIGIPLAVLPGYIHLDLGYSSFIAGLSVSVQYVATLLSRAGGGRLADTAGPKRTVQWGLMLCLASGLFLLLSALLHSHALPSLLTLTVSRIVLGLAESLIGTGAIAWGIGHVGAKHTSRVIAWNGIASYSALAIGAPIGVAMARHWGFASLGILCIAATVAGYLIARTRPETALHIHGETMAFRHVFLRVLPYGAGLGLGTIGFGSIATFISLYYADFNWTGAAYCLTAFGATFVCARLLFAHTIPRHGGLRVAMVSFPIECAGLAMIWLAPAPLWSLLGAALTGMGFSMIFPALAVEAVALVPMRNRGAAIGAYSVFFDIALGITGPVAGLIIGHYGYPAVYLFAACSVALAFLIVIGAAQHRRRASSG